MEPNSAALVVLLLIAAASLIYVVARYRRLLVRIPAAALVLVLSVTAGMAIVNDYYGYYQTWSQLSADFTGNYANFATAIASRDQHGSQLHGRLEAVTFPGPRSGITRSGLVYLPPQYFQPSYAAARFPVVELLHGTPGSPSNWVVHLDVVRLADQLIGAHLMGPMVLVMPTMSPRRDFQECVDAPGALDDTYITDDVRADVLAKFRVSSDPAQWGVAGYSSGGYCAANLALRHPADFGAAGIMDGYFRPQDGPAAAALHFNAAAEASNNPLLLAAALGTDSSPLPAFWVSVGTGNAADLRGALAFGAALHGVERVPFYREPGAVHNFYAWQPAAPRLLAWMWPLLASPQQRVEFPIAGQVQNNTITGVIGRTAKKKTPAAIHRTAVRTAKARPKAHRPRHKAHRRRLNATTRAAQPQPGARRAAHR